MIYTELLWTLAVIVHRIILLTT